MFASQNGMNGAVGQVFIAQEQGVLCCVLALLNNAMVTTEWVHFHWSTNSLGDPIFCRFLIPFSLDPQLGMP
jgi:hypothetical protein